MRRLWPFLALMVGGLLLVSWNFATNDFVLFDATDFDKQMRFDLSQLTTGQQATLTIPNLAAGISYSGTLAIVNQDNSWTSANYFVDEIYAEQNVINIGSHSGNYYQLGGTPTAVRGIILPDFDCTLLGTAGAQTITGAKTFDAASAVPIFSNDASGGTTTYFQWVDTNSGKVVNFNLSSSPAADIDLAMPSSSGALITATLTATLTNKRMTQRVTSMTDATSFTPAGDTSDMATQTNTQAAGTLTANAPSGTPTNGQMLILRIKSTNVQTFAWNGIYRGCTTIALPTATTGSSKTDYFTYRYNSADSKWDLQVANYGY